MSERTNWFRIIGLRRMLCLLLMFVGLLMVLLSPPFSNVGVIVMITGSVLLSVARKKSPPNAQPLPTRQRIVLLFFVFLFLVASVFVSMLFPKDSGLGSLLGVAVIFLGVGFTFWFLFFRRKQ